MPNLYRDDVRDVNNNEIYGVEPPSIGRVAGTLDGSLTDTVVNGQINYTPGEIPYSRILTTGLPPGGSVGQVLNKTSAEDFVSDWTNLSTLQLEGGFPYWATPQEWCASGEYGFLQPGIHFVDTTGLALTETRGATLMGFGACRIGNDANYGAGATIISASGITQGETLIDSSRENLYISNVAFHGIPDNNSADDPIDILFRITDRGGGGANAGTTTFEHVEFDEAGQAGLVLGRSLGESHNERVNLRQCGFDETPIGIQINNTQALHLSLDQVSFGGNVYTGIQVNGGGNIYLKKVTVLNSNSVLLGSLGQGSNGATVTIDHFKFDTQASYSSRLVDTSGSTNDRLNLVVNNGQVAYDDYAANTGYLCRIHEGMSCVMNGVYNLQSGMFRWMSNDYDRANYVLVGCQFENGLDIINILDSGRSTGNVTLRTYGCFGVNGVVLDDVNIDINVV